MVLKKSIELSIFLRKKFTKNLSWARGGKFFGFIFFYLLSFTWSYIIYDYAYKTHTKHAHHIKNSLLPSYKIHSTTEEENNLIKKEKIPSLSFEILEFNKLGFLF